METEHADLKQGINCYNLTIRLLNPLSSTLSGKHWEHVAPGTDIYSSFMEYAILFKLHSKS